MDRGLGLGYRGWMIRGCALLGVMVGAGCFAADNTAAPPGELARFDPIAQFSAMAAYAGPQARLVRMSATYVKSDGTMDFTADYHTRLRVDFVVNASAADVDQLGPVAPGSGYAVGDAIDTQIIVVKPRVRHVSSGGSSWSERHLGMERDPGMGKTLTTTFVAAPTCSFATLWSTAIAAGAPRDVVANIDYDEDGYTFTANGHDFKREFAMDCSLIAE